MRRSVPPLALLCACTCPTFADMGVDDPDRVASNSTKSWIASGIKDFARWTGREGVCVPSVQLVDDEESDHGGLYQGAHQPILVQAAISDPHRITLHELCHAIDDEERLVNGHGALFPESADIGPEHYPTKALRLAEAFARRCARGPQDGLALELLQDECGADLNWTLGDGLVQGQVYTAVDRPQHGQRYAPADGEMVRLDLGLGDGTILDTTQDGSIAYMLVMAAMGEIGHDRPGRSLYLVTLHLGEPTPRVEVEELVEAARLRSRVYDAAFIQTIGEPLVTVADREGDERIWSLLEDPDHAADLAGWQPLPPDFHHPAVLVGDVLVSRQSNGTSRTLMGTDVYTGEDVDLGLDQERWGKTVAPQAMYVDPDGLWIHTEQEGLSRLDAASWTWEVGTKGSWLGGAEWVVRLDDHRWFMAQPPRLPVGYDGWDSDEWVHATAIYDDAADTWHLAEDLCGDASLRWARYGYLSDGQRVWRLEFLGTAEDGDIGLVPVVGADAL